MPLVRFGKAKAFPENCLTHKRTLARASKATVLASHIAFIGYLNVKAHIVANTIAYLCGLVNFFLIHFEDLRGAGHVCHSNGLPVELEHNQEMPHFKGFHLVNAEGPPT